MPSRISAWGVYDVFTVKDGEQIFLAVVSDTQWAIFCEAFGFGDLLADPRLATNNDRVQRARLDDADPALAPGRAQRGRAERGVRGERAALRADHPAAGPVRRSAPATRPAAWRRCA